MKTFPIWGKDVNPHLPWKLRVGQLFQMWRNSIVLSESLFLRCGTCKKDFSIRRQYCQKNVNCPYCGARAEYIETPDEYLYSVCLELVDSNLLDKDVVKQIKSKIGNK